MSTLTKKKKEKELEKLVVYHPPHKLVLKWKKMEKWINPPNLFIYTYYITKCVGGRGVHEERGD